MQTGDEKMAIRELAAPRTSTVNKMSDGTEPWLAKANRFYTADFSRRNFAFIPYRLRNIHPARALRKTTFPTIGTWCGPQDDLETLNTQTHHLITRDRTRRI